MNTALRLAVLIPAMVLCGLIAFVGLGFGGLTVGSIVVASVIAGLPLALLVWTVVDHRKRQTDKRVR